MSKRCRFRTQFQLARFQFGLTLAAVIAVSGLANAQESSVDQARLATFDSSTGETTFALSLTPQGQTSSSGPAKVLIFLDTSASQNGLFREDSIKALKSVLTGLDPKDQVQLMAVDIDPVPLTDGFVSADSSAISVAMDRLDQRLPLGSTDLVAMLDTSAATLAGSDQNKNVIYIGDGISRGALMKTERFRKLVAKLVSRKISVSSFAIGPERDVELLAALANHTGGNVFIDTDDVGSADQAAAGLVATMRGSVFWPNQLDKPSQLSEVFPAVLPPLRSDRDSILVGTLADRSPFDISISGTVDGRERQFSWPVKAEASNDDFKFLPTLVDAAREDAGATLATVGSAGLREMARVITASSHQITSLGAPVLNASTSTRQEGQGGEEEVAPGQPGGSGQGSGSSTKSEGGLVLRDSVAPQQVQGSGSAAQGSGLNLVDQTFDDQQFLQDAEAGSEFLNDELARRAVGTQRLQSYLNNELRLANELLSTKPDLGIDRMKSMLDTVLRAPDLDPEVRLQMETRVRSAIRQANARKQAFDTNLALSERTRAASQERANLIREFEDRESRIAGFFEQFNSLLDERNYTGATDVIFEAAQANPSSPSVVAAEEVSIIQTNFARYWEIRNLKNRGFLNTLYETERSAAPFSGNPPLVFPDADEWIAKKERRKKWQKFAFYENERDQEILEVLDRDAEFDYFETRFADVIDEWQADYKIQIILDESASDNNLTEEELITSSLSNISFRSALRQILGGFDCTYVIRDEVLTIVSNDAATDVENMPIVIYNVGDLVAPRTAGGGGFGGGGFGGGGGGFGGGGGGLGGGGGGLGGGGLGGGGGVFFVGDALQLGASRKQESKPVELKVDPAAEQTKKQAWNEYFQKYHARPADVRETVRVLMRNKNPEEVIAVIEGCLRNDQEQEWMHEAMLLAMQASSESTEQLERMAMSTIDFSNDPENMLNTALFMSRNGMQKRALQLLKFIAESFPYRHEPYAVALRAAKDIQDVEAIKWATLGVLSQEWPDHPEELRSAFLEAEALKLKLERAGKVEELKAFEAQLAEALHRDCVVKVTWSGQADLDLFVEEPGGTVCSREHRRTISGGVLLGDKASQPDQGGQVSEFYVLPKGFKGDYRVAIRRIWGEIPTGKVTVEVYRNFRSKNETSIKRQVKLDQKGAIVLFKLDEGRRTEKLNRGAVEVASRQGVLPDKAEIARRLSSYRNSIASRRHSMDNPEAQRQRRQLLANDGIQRPVGFAPVINQFFEGVSATVQATTADRLYVIVSSPFQNFSEITEVETFTFLGGGAGAGGVGGAGGGLGGVGGAGGIGG